MIEYMPRSGPPEAQNCPAVICDACRQQVVGKGNIVWAFKVVRSDSETRQQSPLFATHKGKCDRALDAWMKNQYSEDSWLLQWEELGTFLKQLSFNAENAFADDTEGVYHQHILKLPTGELHREVPRPPAP